MLCEGKKKEIGKIKGGRTGAREASREEKPRRTYSKDGHRPHGPTPTGRCATIPHATGRTPKETTTKRRRRRSCK